MFWGLDLASFPLQQVTSPLGGGALFSIDSDAKAFFGSVDEVQRNPNSSFGPHVARTNATQLLLGLKLIVS